ncbi:hypothetical protein PFISCL1PPCAC_2568, partial [Pristionchus fissidentatus]
GGRCPIPLPIPTLGGYGGGGPACGESPGPGGGYIGGKRRGNISTGGSSFVFDGITIFNVFEGIHTGEGFVRIFPCNLDCPINQTCSFTSASRGDQSKMECRCIEGLEC